MKSTNTKLQQWLESIPQGWTKLPTELAPGLVPSHAEEIRGDCVTPETLESLGDEAWVFSEAGEKAIIWNYEGQMQDYGLSDDGVVSAVLNFWGPLWEFQIKLVEHRTEGITIEFFRIDRELAAYNNADFPENWSSEPIIAVIRDVGYAVTYLVEEQTRFVIKLDSEVADSLMPYILNYEYPSELLKSAAKDAADLYLLDRS